MAILDVKRLELAKSQLTTEQIFKIKREKFKIKNEIVEIKKSEKPEKESELKLNTREDIDKLIGQLLNAKKLTPEEWFMVMVIMTRVSTTKRIFDFFMVRVFTRPKKKIRNPTRV